MTYRNHKLSAGDVPDALLACSRARRPATRAPRSAGRLQKPVGEQRRRLSRQRRQVDDGTVERTSTD
jgi:hypothetical protein